MQEYFLLRSITSIFKMMRETSQDILSRDIEYLKYQWKMSDYLSGVLVVMESAETWYGLATSRMAS